MTKLFLSAVLFTSLLQMTSCKKMDCGSPHTKSDCDLIPVKILRYDCDRVIFQLVTDERIGDAEWTDEATGETYSNVASFYNTCAITEITNGDLSTLYVSVKKTEEFLSNEDCIQCMAVSTNVPKTWIDFSVLKTEPCNAGAAPQY